MVKETVRIGNVILHKCNGVPHRVNGPAFIWDDGAWGWSLYGEAHRYYGRALSNTGWWIHDHHIKE
jgi:hypothetical protein